jgi:hypothetical protein
MQGRDAELQLALGSFACPASASFFPWGFILACKSASQPAPSLAYRPHRASAAQARNEARKNIAKAKTKKHAMLRRLTDGRTRQRRFLQAAAIASSRLPEARPTPPATAIVRAPGHRQRGSGTG